MSSPRPLCPLCGVGESLCVDTRKQDGVPWGVRRRRVCGDCGHRFTTMELPWTDELKAVMYGTLSDQDTQAVRRVVEVLQALLAKGSHADPPA